MQTVDFTAFKRRLRAENYFVTKPRLRLFAYLHHHPAITIKELINAVDQNDPATIYRNIDLFEKLSVINRVQLGWQTKIELSDSFQYHHHHASCTSCSRSWVLPKNSIIEQQIPKLTCELPFSPVSHQLEIRGLCSKCRTKNL